MNKIKVVLGVIFIFMAVRLRAEELRPQFRAWKSSYIGTASYGNVILSTSPILFHLVFGSATVNQGGDNFFVLYRSTGNNGAQNSFNQLSSTKAFIPLNQSAIEHDKIGYQYDVFSDSYTFWKKVGGANVGFEYDFYKEVGFNPFTKE